jgi:hypothetical protein
MHQCTARHGTAAAATDRPGGGKGIWRPGHGGSRRRSFHPAPADHCYSSCGTRRRGSAARVVQRPVRAGMPLRYHGHGTLLVYCDLRVSFLLTCPSWLVSGAALVVATSRKGNPGQVRRDEPGAWGQPDRPFQFPIFVASAGTLAARRSGKDCE